MAGNLLYGLFCVRLLPITEYAKFAVIFGFLPTLTMLSDVSFSATLIPLVGERIDDLQLIADYVASLRYMARRLYLLVAPVAILIFPLLVYRQHWSWPVVVGMLSILLAAAWFARVSAIYGAVLIVRRDRARWYRAQMVSSLGTLVLLCIFWPLGWLNAFSAATINVGGISLVGLSFFLRSRTLLGVTGYASQQKRRAIVHLAMPNLPNFIFYAFQGQIALLLITIFGRPFGMASVGALGRLGQVFAILGQKNPILIEPYFAKLPKSRLRRNYFGALAAECAACLFVTAIAYFFPELFLWVLGPKYNRLRFEVFLQIAVSSIYYVSGVMSVIHSARKFVYWWNSLFFIVLTLAVQCVFIWKVDLSSVRGILTLNLATGLVMLLISALTGVFGFTRGPRQVPTMEMQMEQGERSPF